MARPVKTKLVDAKYGTVYLENPPESALPVENGKSEPVFIIRGQDDLAAAIVTRYLNMADQIEDESVRPSREWFRNMEQVVNDFNSYRQQNADKIKVAD